MRVATDFLVPHERLIGQYQMQIARRTSTGGWTPTIPPLHVVATNYRLLLWPQTRRVYPPASLPCTYIAEARELTMDRWLGLAITLHDGNCIYLMSSDVRRLIRNIRLMVKPPLSIGLYMPPLNRDQVNRLLHSISHL